MEAWDWTRARVSSPGAPAPRHISTPRDPPEPSGADARRLSGVKSSDPARDEVSAQAMLRQATHGFSSGIEAGDDLTEDIYHLLVRVDPEAGERIMENGSRPRRMEGRRLDLVHRFGLLEVGVDSRSHEGVVPLDGLLKDRSRHRPLLVRIVDVGRQLFQRRPAREIERVYIGWLGIP